MVAKSGGADPDTNPKLRLLIQNAKSENMPKDNIERAIRRATDKDTKEYKEVVYEGYGPYGVAILVETATDNPTRTVANIRSYFNKHGGSLGTSGMLDFMFEHKCSFRIDGKDSISLDELELELIDYGVEEVFVEDDSILIFADFAQFGPVQRYLEGKGLHILNFQFERIPTDTKKLTPEQQEEVEKLVDKIEEDEDVTHVFHNMEIA